VALCVSGDCKWKGDIVRYVILSDGAEEDGPGLSLQGNAHLVEVDTVRLYAQRRI
jgi:hypothetical protein